MAPMRRNREVMGLPPLTREDIDESPHSSRYIGEDQFWMDALKSRKLSYTDL
jgi:hypothetical protein